MYTQVTIITVLYTVVGVLDRACDITCLPYCFCTTTPYFLWKPTCSQLSALHKFPIPTLPLGLPWKISETEVDKF